MRQQEEGEPARHFCLCRVPGPGHGDAAVLLLHAPPVLTAGAPPPPPGGEGEPEPGEPGAPLLLLLHQDGVPVPTPHSFQPGLDMSAMFDY